MMSFLNWNYFCQIVINSSYCIFDMSQAKPTLGFAQKFGLKYFSFLLNLVIYVGIFELIKSMEIAAFAAVFLLRIGQILPNDDVQKDKNANEYNKTWYHMTAPAVSILYLYFMLYYTWINYSEFNHSYQSLISACLALGVFASLTIDASHQLIHRNEKPLKVIGFIGLIPYLFTTYPIEHLFMHHKNVGTPEDDITAPKNMPYIKYYFRSVFSSYRETFKYSKVFFAFCMILHLGYLFALYQFGLNQFAGDHELALRKVGFFVALAFSCLFVMESIEYIEHYGLIYRKNNQQKPVLEISSWNTTVNPLYNWTIFRFQRHSDHHMNAYKVYSSLELNEKMPLYPFSFPEAISACWIPGIWYKITDHLVDKVINHEKITKDDIERTKYWMRVSNILSAALLIANVWFSQSFNNFLESNSMA